MNTIPFDIEKAKAGYEVVTRDGRKVINVRWHSFLERVGFPVKAEIEGREHVFTEKGIWRPPTITEHDLLLINPVNNKTIIQ